MRLGFGLQMQQTQRLIMTPELRQAIAVLQKPVAELSEMIDGELLDNPCLEAQGGEGVEQPTSPTDLRRLIDYLKGGGTEGGSAGQQDEDEPTFEAASPSVPTLQDYLMGQLHLLRLKQTDRRIAEFLIGSLDDHGYLTISLPEVAEQLAVSLKQVERALAMVQSFDPAGVGASSLKECLLLQWQGKENDNPLVRPIIENHLDDLAAGRIPRIADRLGASCLQVQQAADLIRTLDPKPGRSFGRADGAHYIIPDVVVERVGQEYVVVVNDTPLPKLLVNQHYRQLLQGSEQSEATKFVEEKIQSALWLIKAIEQRRITLYRVAEAIVQFQRDFFDRGTLFLKPLTLRQVAEAVGVHESTVSRATSGKYVQTPQGTFDLKFFFTSGVEGGQGEGVAAESVKRLIADLIAREDSAEPLSDQALTDRLGQQGIAISRRTVAKYREEMGVPSSGKRRRYA